MQNLDRTEAATGVADFYAQDGGPRVEIPLGSIAPSAAANIWLPGQPQLRSGAYAAMVHTDKPVAAIVRTDWWQTGGAAMYSNPVPGHEVVVPLVIRVRDQASLISVQNSDAAGAIPVTVLFHASGQEGPVLSQDYVVRRGVRL